MLFQPLEDTSRNLFAKLCNPTQSSDSSSAAKSDANAKATSTSVPPSPSNLAQAAHFLITLLKFYSLLSLAAWSLGPPIAPHLLALIAGSRWTSTGAGEVLAAYCYYIPLLALNGVTEAFVAATATTSELRTQSGLMALWFGAFAIVAWLLLGVWRMGAEGLVWANCVNMALRVMWNLSFVKGFFAKYGAELKLRTALPEVASVAAAVGVGAILRARTEQADEGLIGHLVRSSAVAIVFVAILAISERRFVLELIGMAQGLAGSKEETKKSVAKGDHGEAVSGKEKEPVLERSKDR